MTADDLLARVYDALDCRKPAIYLSEADAREVCTFRDIDGKYFVLGMYPSYIEHGHVMVRGVLLLPDRRYQKHLHYMHMVRAERNLRLLGWLD